MDKSCNRDTAYLSIIITVLPFWVILTTLIVYIILLFHKFSRSNRIYDNCNKHSARYVYYIEIRTGDSSNNYNKRRSTIFVDMFDESQTVLAKVAIPSHIIFGRKDLPSPIIEDEKYPDLRVARFWLYRQVRLKKVSTIRFTHSCLEPDAKIMIYGMEIRSDEPSKHRLFFPVMSYITAYGVATRQNACFDLEPNGSLGAMGGASVEASPLAEQLNTVDYALLFYVLAGLLFAFTPHDILVNGSLTDLSSAALKGAIIGILTYFIVIFLAAILRYVFKHYFSLYIATGLIANLYYVFGGFNIIMTACVWIYTTIYAYANLCGEHYNFWLVSLTVASSECILLCLLTFLITILIGTTDRSSEQFLNEDNINREDSKTSSTKTRLQQLQQATVTQTINQASPHPGHGHGSWTVQPMPYMIPPVQTYQPQQNVYNPAPVMMGAMVPHQAAYKTNVPNNYGYPAGHGTHTINFASPGTVTNTINNAPQPIRPTKKVGSSESTGSSYYQQLMKNKGGVKSISQYGELLKQKKAGKGSAK